MPWCLPQILKFVERGHVQAAQLVNDVLKGWDVLGDLASILAEPDEFVANFLGGVLGLFHRAKHTLVGLDVPVQAIDDAIVELVQGAMLLAVLGGPVLAVRPVADLK